jgi:cell division protein FtsI/penicillin-binding protein 2
MVLRNDYKKTILLVFFASISFILIFRLYIIQIKNHEYYKALVLGQQISFKEIPPKRGDIFFSDGITPLAKTVETVVLSIYPQKVNNLENFIEDISNITGEDKEKLIEEFSKSKLIQKEIPFEKLSIFKNKNYSGWDFQINFKRIYPENNIASNVVGFLNKDFQGQYGLEGYYENILSGKKETIQKETSPFKYSIFSQSNDIFNNNAGASLVLTIDKSIQYFAQKVIENAAKNFEIEKGEIVIVNPNNGEILANAVFPSFDPNNYQKTKDISYFKNFSASDLFEPGSIFKPITFAAALEENLITPDDIFEDKGVVNLGGKPIYNFHQKTWGKITMTEVLQNSVNTGAVFVEQKLGKDRFLSYLEKFGFFEPTGVDIQGESFSKNMVLKNGKERDIAVASFGQGINVNSFQIIQAFSAICNGGKLITPHFVKKIIYPNGNIIDIKPVVKKEILNKETSEKLSSMLIQVVEKGSGWRTKMPGYEIAGKTGTAQIPLPNGQYSQEDTIQSFVGYLPAFEPKVLIFVKLVKPKNSPTAEYAAVLTFKEIAKNIIDYLQIAPNLVKE